MDVLKFKHNEKVVEIYLSQYPLKVIVDKGTTFWRNTLRQAIKEGKQRAEKWKKDWE